MDRARFVNGEWPWADALGEGPFGSLISDFGRLVEGMATGQVRPATMEEVVAAVATARDSEDGSRFVPAHIASAAKPFPDRSRVLDVTRLDAVRVEDATALCGPAATLRQVVDATLPNGLLPVLEV